MLIGLIGKKSSGKDTFSDFLVCHYGFQKRAFADPLKKCCQLLFGLTDQQIHDPMMKETMDERWEMTPRKIMQVVGTDLFRHHFDVNFWLKLFENWYNDHKENDIVCSDVRFENEAKLIKKLGGVLIRIHRPYVGNDSHESETIDISFHDFEIMNDSTLDDYQKNIDELSRTILGKTVV